MESHKAPLYHQSYLPSISYPSLIYFHLFPLAHITYTPTILNNMLPTESQDQLQDLLIELLFIPKGNQHILFPAIYLDSNVINDN